MWNFLAMFRRALALFSHLSSFAADRRGQVALTFGFAAVPVLVIIGAAIDYSRSVQQRSNLQQATDAAALAIARSYLSSSATTNSLKDLTQKYLTGAMNMAAGDKSVTVNGFTGTRYVPTVRSVTLSDNNTRMCIYTGMIVPTQIISAVGGASDVLVGATACALGGSGSFEVAMALDNSYSMIESLGSQTKMDALHDAANALVDILIPDGTAAPTAAISLVPFNALVNVGTDTTKPFLDKTGQSSLNWRIIQKPQWTTNPSRFDLFNSMYTSSTKKATVPWAGCVEERPNNQYSSLGNDSTNYLTTDIAAASGDSLFVPYFAPDDPGDLDNTKQNSTYVYYNEDFDDSGISATGKNSNYRFLNSYLADSGYKTTLGSCSGNDPYEIADAKLTNTYPKSGITMACKYKGSVASIGPQWFGLSNGPNASCSTPAVTPLSTNKTILKTAINAMDPEGLTNLGTGFMWAWRTVSPVVNPFPIANPPVIGQQNPKAYDIKTPQNTKIIILMTDGFNTWSPFIDPDYGNMGVNNPFKSAYETFGFMSENRLANYSTTCPAADGKPKTGSGFVSTYTTYRCQMDNMLLEACANFKAQTNTVVYTVAFSTSKSPIDQQGINVLKGCASAGNYYQAADGDGIVAAFQNIGRSILQLRLAS